MADQVKVEDFEVFSLFRAAMLKFAQAVTQSLSNADSQIARTHSWLEGEQRSYWEGQIRKRQEAVLKAREAVRQKKLYKDSSGHTRTAIEEEKILAQCVAAVEEAQRKLEAIRKWLPRLEKAADLYRSGVSRLSRTVEGDVPRAVALLDRLAVSLEGYVQIEAPAGSMPESAAATTLEESMTRGGDAAPGGPGKADGGAAGAGGSGAPAPEGESKAGMRREGRDVAE